MFSQTQVKTNEAGPNPAQPRKAWNLPAALTFTGGLMAATEWPS